MSLSTSVIPLLLILSIAGPVYGQTTGISQVRTSAEQLRTHVFTLASDEFQGRKTGTPGQMMATNYCIRSFRQSHLVAPFRFDSTKSSLRQAFAFTTTQVARFGYSSQQTYLQHELVPLPRTAKDSSRVSIGYNVGGLLMGTDLKQEVVVISAHYDHLGETNSRVFYGADDNASGTATALAIASVFDSLAQQGVRARRSVLFLLFSGEEEGLLGSIHYVNNSSIPLSQLVCNLNIDMVGRVDNSHRRKPDYCYLIRDERGEKLQKAAEAANRASVNLALNEGGYDVRNDPERFFYRSDQYNFAKFGIPALFFTSGQHADYHQLSDTADKINYDVLQKRATLIFQTAWLLANE